MHFEFEHPVAFALLALIVCIYKCPLPVKTILFVHTHLFERRLSLINREKLLYSLILALMVTALASPVTYDAESAQHRKGRDLVFAVDTSGSMHESGYSAENGDASKFDILKRLMSTFIRHRYDDNVGVVVFGSYAFAAVPITYDMHSLAFLIDFLDVGMAGSSTAIGDGIARSLDLLRRSHAKNKVIVLFTDGYQNSGSTRIKDAVAEAKKAGVRIYTVGIGKPDEYDAKLLKRIAGDTGGKAFGAKNAAELEAVYEALDELEPSAIRSRSYLNKHPLFAYPLAAAFLLLFYLLMQKRSR